MADARPSGGQAAAGCLSLLGGSVLQYGPAFFQHFGVRTAVSMHLGSVGMGTTTIWMRYYFPVM